LRHGNLGGQDLRIFSTAAKAIWQSTPENVSPTSKDSPWRLKLQWSSGVKMEFAWNFPVSKPLARGTRAIMPTCQTPTRFCGNCLTILPEAGDQALASTIAINVGSVDEIYATVDRFV
jgi:hypothetical protein